MKISERWLREWLDAPEDLKAVAHKLNMAGIEAEAEPLLQTLPRGVVVARIEALAPHPQADKLRVCTVNAGEGGPRTVVCGAANARVGMVAPLALPGAVLAGLGEIKESPLRGVMSAGMLCSAAELGLAEKSDGLLELDAQAPLGTPIEDYLQLKDQLLSLEITPNRGDCLSLAGVARELGALYSLTPKTVAHIEPAVDTAATMPVRIDDPLACTRYLGRAVSGIDAQARTPDWMRERLRRGGIRCIHPAVDIANYVMLELGQPMHAFDLTKLSGTIQVRRARPGEQLLTLTGETAELHGDDLIIADDQGPLALAGVMGGSASAVGAASTEVFFESAWFDPVTIAQAGRRHRLLSDSRYRFERGVDSSLQLRALNRAVSLMMEIAGGKAGPLAAAEASGAAIPPIRLRLTRLHRLVGHPIPAEEAVSLLQRLGFEPLAVGEGEWTVAVAPHRPDVRIEPDLVEEIARLYGYERIPPRAYKAELSPWSRPETVRALDSAKDALVARGYAEVVTYSFVDPKLEAALFPETTPIRLDNPIAETMAVMRASLWPGLLSSWRHNAQRQQPRARLFEAGACFFMRDGEPSQRIEIAGLIAGSALPEQWAAPIRPVDFYDLSADLRALISPRSQLRLQRAEHSALHPGRSARIELDGQPAGWIGCLHPRIAAKLDLGESPYLFSLEWALASRLPLPQPSAPSEFPASRRDRAVVVPEAVDAETLCRISRESGGESLREVFIFDVYRGSGSGAGLATGHKSVTVGLIFQQPSRTLTVDEIDAAVGEITAALVAQAGAVVRG